MDRHPEVYEHVRGKESVSGQVSPVLSNDAETLPQGSRGWRLNQETGSQYPRLAHSILYILLGLIRYFPI